MAALTACTLPIVQLVCNLIASEPPSNVTNSAVDQFPPQLQAGFLPDGYVMYPKIAAYKAYNDYDVTFMEAKNLCAREGAQLAVIDSFEKLEYFRRLMPSSEWVHAGIIRMDDTWVSGNTGLRVASPWETGYPYGQTDCVFLRRSKPGLQNESCGTKARYVCEFPILVAPTVASNEDL